MGWIGELVLRNQDDFWLNVLAGIPFLFFDLVIITLLLPITIQWFDDYRWKETRVRAISHVLEQYRSINEYTDRLKADSQATNNPITYDSLLRTLANHSAHVDTELQTALPVLGPDLSQELLEFHYSWKQLIADIAQQSRLHTNPNLAPAGILSLANVKSIMVASLVAAHRQLAIKWAGGHSTIWYEIRRTDFPLNQFADLYIRAAKNRMDPSLGDLIDEKYMVKRDALACFHLLMTTDANPPKFVHYGLSGLTRHRRRKLYASSPAALQSIAEQHEAIRAAEAEHGLERMATKSTADV